MRTPARRIGDIECLRGVAVLMVIFYHAPTALFTWPMPLLQDIEDHYLQTWPGVDLFFAISGFVIARTLLPSLATSEDKFRLMGAFWVRRFWRLVPSAWAWLGVIMVACVLFNRSGVFETFHTNFESALAAMLSVANFREAAAFKNFPYGPSATYWSLSLEEQFYIVLPVLAYLSGRWLLPVLLVITIAVFSLPSYDEPLVMMLRVHAILLGVLLAVASDKPAYAAFAPGFLRNRKWAGLLLLLFLVVMISVLAPYGQRITSYPLDLIAILCAVLVFIASHDQDFLVGYRPIRVVLTWVGTRSYALYLIHIPAFFAARELWFRLSPPGTIFGPHDFWRLSGTALALLLLCAEANYRLLELPLRRHGAVIAARIAGETTYRAPPDTVSLSMKNPSYTRSR
jgi:peptidoglycan/LPS O-acetylase OafA/YrhL